MAPLYINLARGDALAGDPNAIRSKAIRPAEPHVSLRPLDRHQAALAEVLEMGQGRQSRGADELWIEADVNFGDDLRNALTPPSSAARIDASRWRR